MFRPPKTKYPCPPERDIWEPFPATVPWDTPIVELTNWWISMRCSHCAYHHTDMPIRLLAARRGWNLTLRQIVPRIVCEKCRHRPQELQLVDTASGDAGGRRMKVLDLLAGPPPQVTGPAP